MNETIIASGIAAVVSIGGSLLVYFTNRGNTRQSAQTQMAALADEAVKNIINTLQEENATARQSATEALQDAKKARAEVQLAWGAVQDAQRVVEEMREELRIVRHELKVERDKNAELLKQLQKFEGC